MCIKTIVTSELFKAICVAHDVSCLDVLTGFKYIGQKIAQWEEDQKAAVSSHHFLFGGEESFGYLFGTHARDKDAVIAAALVCDMALHLKLQGKTLIDFLYEIYHKYGVYREKLISLAFEGKEGLEKIAKMMNHLRQNPPQEIAGVKVSTIEDYQNHTLLHLETGHKEPLLLPKSDVLCFWLADNTKIVVRPSGTEPKIKVYCGAFERHFLSTPAEIDAAIATTDLRIDHYMEVIEKLLKD